MSKLKIFKKPLLSKVKNTFYKDMLKGIDKYQQKNCRRLDGVYPCSNCEFHLEPYCLLNALKSDFKRFSKTEEGL